MSAQDPGFFWYKVSLTLRSRLTPEQVREQLSKASPLFHVDTGHPVARLPVFFLRGRIFCLRLREGTFRVEGPLYRGEGFPSSFGGLVVKGSVEPDDQESFIHLNVENSAVAIPFFIGLVLIVLSVCAIALDYFPVIVYGGVPLTFLGIILYLRFLIPSRTHLRRLVLCLEKILSAQHSSRGGGGGGSAASSTVVIDQSGDGTRSFAGYHIAHLILTILTCGLWFPVWLIHWLMWLRMQ